MKKTKKPPIDIYKAKDGWRWRVHAKNGKIVAESGEGYTSRVRCLVGASAALKGRLVITQESR